MPELKTALSVGEVVANSYQVIELAGAGGMGVVYRARDVRLERNVALKFLPAELNSNPREKERFLTEARTASSLDHPNIGVIHGIEETGDGHTFIVMAFYEGESLAERVSKGPLSPDEAIDIACQMLRGLAEAHAKHIIHRDIKPSNVMLTPAGVIKIVDFGLARVISEKTATLTGISGTVSYMSPEQSLGKSGTPRSDIWAVGVVLAEMLTGNNPFERETISSVVLAILNEAPRSLEGVPSELQGIIYRALSKNPEKRYSSCSEMLHDLERFRTAGVNGTASVSSPRPRGDISRLVAEATKSALLPTSQPRLGWKRWVIAALVLVFVAGGLLLIPSIRERTRALFFGSREKHIAVLPFDNIGKRPENEALVEGLMDSLAGKLSNLDVGSKSLWVIPTSEVRRRKVTDPSAALKELDANLVVKGSVQRDGQDVHLNVNLIDTKNLRQVGSAELEDQGGDLSTLQNEAVSRLARLMNLSVSADMLRNTGGSVDPAAYEDYLKALGHMQRYDKPGNLDLAVTALKNSVHTDPRFALGYAQLGEAYLLKYKVDQNKQWLNEAQAYGQKAVEIDNRIPGAYITLGRIHAMTGQHDLALPEFQHALDIDPRNAVALTGLASAYEDSGRIQDATTAFQKAAALRPDDWDGYNNLGNFYDRQSKYPEAIKAYHQAIELTPDNAEAYLNLGATYLDAGDAKDFVAAEDALKKSIELNPSYPAYANLGALYDRERRYADAAAATRKALQLNDKDYRVWNNLVAESEWLNDQDTAEAARKRMLPLVEQAAALKPQDAIIQSTLAMVYAHSGARERALAHVETSLALAPDDPNVLSHVATTYEMLHDRAHALEYVRRSLHKGLAPNQIRNDPDMQQLLKDPNFHGGKP
jgi:serine/threonine protein kinase/tetratricopeptide (TPR) repeat protein